MIFDVLARVAERSLPKLAPIISATRLFVFPGRAHEVLPKEESRLDFSFIQENFFLPFRNIAVEDTASCIMLWDAERDQRGLDKVRHFLECTELCTPLSEFNDELSPAEKELFEHRLQHVPKGAISIVYGHFNSINVSMEGDRHRLVYDAALDGAHMVSPEGVVTPALVMCRSKEDIELLSHGTIRNAGTAIQEVYFFNSPDRFILEEMPVDYERRKKKAEKAGRIVRRCDRPIYTILYPHEIRRRLRLPPLASGGPKRPHERRSHIRSYPDNPKRWPIAHGKSVIVPASWVGPSTATIGKKIYKVLLDR